MTILSRITLAFAPIGLAFGLASSAAWAARPLSCLGGKAAAATTLPSELEVGVETIHKDPERIITVFTPLASNGTPSRVMDTNAKKPTEPLPEVFAISDGTVRTPFVGIDRRPGTRLAKCIDEIAARIPKGRPDAAQEFIRDHLQADYLKEPPKGHRFDWDRKPGEQDPAELTELFKGAKDMMVGHYPLRSKQKQKVVGLEEFLRAGYGTCLHKALLAALVLEKLKIPYRLVNGAMRSGGHVWIALGDGRILDPSLQKLEFPHELKTLPGWIEYGDHQAFENQVWPFLALP